jgi:hypothetical protein
VPPEPDDFSANRHPAPAFCLSIVPRVKPKGCFSEKAGFRFFRIVLQAI